MEAAKAQHSVRWSKRQVRNCTPVRPTNLNPAIEKMKQEQKTGRLDGLVATTSLKNTAQ